jgi:hypothetical protein
VLAVEARRTDTMSEAEALATGLEPLLNSGALALAEKLWNARYPKSPWGGWAWKVSVERV